MCVCGWADAEAGDLADIGRELLTANLVTNRAKQMKEEAIYLSLKWESCTQHSFPFWKFITSRFLDLVAGKIASTFLLSPFTSHSRVGGRKQGWRLVSGRRFTLVGRPGHLDRSRHSHVTVATPVELRES